MIIIYIKDLNEKLEVKEEETILELLENNSIKIRANCEGNGACGQCLIEFDREIYEKMDIEEVEYDLIEKQTKRTKYARLACQVKIEEFMDGCSIRIL